MLETTQRSHLLSAIDMNSSFFGFVTSKINVIIFMFYMNFRKRFATKAVVNVFWLRSLSIFNTSHLVTSAELCRLHRKKKLKAKPYILKLSFHFLTLPIQYHQRSLPNAGRLYRGYYTVRRGYHRSSGILW